MVPSGYSGHLNTMKPSDLVETDPLYDEYWMLRFLQDTPGFGYGIYRLCEIAETCIRQHLKDDTDLNEVVRAPIDLDHNFLQYIDGNHWNYEAIIRSLRQRCNSTLALLEKHNKN